MSHFLAICLFFTSYAQAYGTFTGYAARIFRYLPSNSNKNVRYETVIQKYIWYITSTSFWIVFTGRSKSFQTNVFHLFTTKLCKILFLKYFLATSFAQHISALWKLRVYVAEAQRLYKMWSKYCGVELKWNWRWHIKWDWQEVLKMRQHSFIFFFFSSLFAIFTSENKWMWCFPIANKQY